MKSIHQERYAILVKKIVDERKAKSLTQLQVAEKLNKPQSYIAKIEGKERKLDVVEFVDLCTALNLLPSEVISDCFE